MAGLIVLDASVVIAYLDAEDAHHRRAEELLVREAAAEFGMSTLTLAEVMVVPARARRLDDVVGVLREVGVRELSFAEGASERLARLRADTGLRMPDCCVLLAAEQAGGVVASFDDRLVAAAQARYLEVLTG